MSQCRDRQWVERMERAITGCAPHVVEVLAGSGAHDVGDPDLPELAGHLIIEIAGQACAEDWPPSELPGRARRATRARLIAQRLPAFPAATDLSAHDPVALRGAVAAVVEGLPPVQRVALGLLTEGLSPAEVAVAVGGEAAWVESCWTGALAQVQARLTTP